MSHDSPTRSTFEFDGHPVPFNEGQSVGAALTAAGIKSWRTTRIDGQPRGLFCGIGVCFDCLVCAGGHPNQRACLLQATSGLVVTTQEGTGHDNLAI